MVFGGQAPRWFCALSVSPYRLFGQGSPWGKEGGTCSWSFPGCNWVWHGYGSVFVSFGMLTVPSHVDREADYNAYYLPPIEGNLVKSCLWQAGKFTEVWMDGARGLRGPEGQLVSLRLGLKPHSWSQAIVWFSTEGWHPLDWKWTRLCRVSLCGKKGQTRPVRNRGGIRLSTARRPLLGRHFQSVRQMFLRGLVFTMRIRTPSLSRNWSKSSYRWWGTPLLSIFRQTKMDSFDEKWYPATVWICCLPWHTL